MKKAVGIMLGYASVVIVSAIVGRKIGKGFSNIKEQERRDVCC